MKKNEEQITLSLRSLYRKYGYMPFKMSKFEEYDFYSRHKEFLVSDRVLTFTDTGGKLMALKPDVTLSIIKNSRDSAERNSVERYCYNENVYRVSDKTHAFSEIMQTGLECIGDVGKFNIFEVAQLAALSLDEISDESVLALSHLGVVSELLDGVEGEERTALLECVDSKNTGGIRQIGAKIFLPDKKIDLLAAIASPELSSAEPDELIRTVREITDNEHILSSVSELEAVVKYLSSSASGVKISADLSLVSDMSYYNGIIFRGYVKGVPTSILRGGQYDKLMKKMGKSSRAIGFAVYLDMLGFMEGDKSDYDADVLLLYKSSDDPAAVLSRINELVSEGKKVSAQTSIPEKLTYREAEIFGAGKTAI